MTVTTEDTKEVLLGDGSTTQWEFNFAVFAPDDIRVFITSLEGEDEDLAYGTDYTVELFPNQNTTPGGIVTTLAPVGVRIPFVIQRVMEFTRVEQYENSVTHQQVEAELDRLTMYAQQLKERIERSLHVSAAQQDIPKLNLSNQLTRADKVIAFDEEGDAVLLELLAGGVVRGPPGLPRTSHVEVSAPAVFNQASNGIWSHLQTTVTFRWVTGSVVTEERSITASIDPDTGLFLPTAEFGISVTGVGTRLLSLTATVDGVSEFIQLATVLKTVPSFPSATFFPAWTPGQFLAAPSGLLVATDVGGVVTIKSTGDIIGMPVSEVLEMSWVAGTLPVAMRPTDTRRAMCVLHGGGKDVLGEMWAQPDGSCVFHVAHMDSSGRFIADVGGIPAIGAKGLPEGWCVTYTR